LENDLKGGHVLSQEEIAKYKLLFRSNDYGDVIYLAEPGKLIKPNFYTIRGETVKAMHGWDPGDQQQDSFLTNFGYMHYVAIKLAVLNNFPKNYLLEISPCGKIYT